MPENIAQFIAAELVIALEFLHTKLHIIYRDLKPENIIIDKEGFVKLTDFGLSRILKDNDLAFTYTGTPEYIAPEIIYRTGHSYESDLWSLGVILYEMLNGVGPFCD